MDLTRQTLDAAVAFVATFNLIAVALAALTVRRVFAADRLPVGDMAAIGAALVVPTLGAWLWGDDPVPAAAMLIIALLIAATLRRAFPQLTVPGILLMARWPLGLAVAAPWTFLLIREHEPPAFLLALILFGIVVALPLGLLGFAGDLARQAILTHRAFRRPHAPLARSGATPKVSIHLPCYSEPPEVVIAVLDRLARLDYPSFEVLVCDNNTPDEAMWRPLALHCSVLNQACGFERFRFFHVAPLAGAKAGALNYLLDRTAPDASLVAVIDADYLARPDFLSGLVGYFADERIAYVQTPHDYREYSDSVYLRGCYWEYMPSNKVEMPGVNEYGAAFTIGTMCILRRDALERAGRWAEWCLTEDSEVSVRLRGLGYGGVYVQETFGRGLIPETFDDYKKQRFRWTAGPMQQLRRYWRHYLPRSMGGSDVIDGWSKLLEVQRAAAPLGLIAATVLGLVATIGGAALILSGAMQPLDMPEAAWLALMLGALATGIQLWHRLTLTGCHSLRDMALGEFARMSLSFVQMVGALAGLTSRPLAWRRTPKFKAARTGLRALSATLPETLLGCFYLLLIVAVLNLSDQLGGDFTLLATLGCLFGALRFLAAPAMALLGEARLEQAAPDHVHDSERLQVA